MKLKRILLFLGLALLVTSCGTVSTSTVTTGDDFAAPKSETTTDRRSPELKFVEDHLEPLIKSASSLTDSTWQYNVVEPLENYKAGSTTADSTISDINLAIDLFNNKAAELKAFQIPDDVKLNETVKTYLLQMIDDLSKAVQGRADVASVFVEKINSGEYSSLTQEDIDNLLLDSNTNLQLAVANYKFILENIE